MRVTRIERLEAVAPANAGRFAVFAFDVEATVEGPIDPVSGMVVNLAAMKEALRREIVAPLAGRCLDGRRGLPLCPTPEALARAIWRRLGGEIAGRPLVRIRLAGRAGPVVDCYGEGEMELTRVYEFSASHRLHSPRLGEEENRRLFGKCNRPGGHGHNYVLEVTVRGEPGESGRVFPPGVLDRLVHAEVVDRWDHRNLNADLPEFAGLNPTAEQIARIAWERIEAAVRGAGGSARLVRVRLRETERNVVEYEGD